MRQIFTCLFVIALATLPEAASAASIVGNWSGSGRATLKNGEVERVRCRIKYDQGSGRTFVIYVDCSHSNGTFQVSGRVVQHSDTSYSGRLYSDQYSVSGQVSVKVSGNSQTLTATSKKGTATVSLKKR